MFEPGDPRHDEILDLANRATANLLSDSHRPRWRELVRQLLGTIQSEGGKAERRQELRGPAELEVDILAPEEMASLATSTVSAGGLSIRIAEVIPAGTQVDLSIRVPQRKVEQLISPLALGSHDASSREKSGSLTSPPVAHSSLQRLAFSFWLQ